MTLYFDPRTSEVSLTTGEPAADLAIDGRLGADVPRLSVLGWIGAAGPRQMHARPMRLHQTEVVAADREVS